LGGLALLAGNLEQKSATLKETNISHHRKRKIIFKSALARDMLVPWRVEDAQLNIEIWIDLLPSWLTPYGPGFFRYPPKRSLTFAL